MVENLRDNNEKAQLEKKRMEQVFSTCHILVTSSSQTGNVQ